MSWQCHIDTFARDHLPAPEQQPEYLFELPELQYPERLNCATELLGGAVARGLGDAPCILAPGVRWTYGELLANANRIARVLVQDMGVVPGNRVLLRGANSPMMAACWFAVMKVGAIAVTTMPLLRAKELGRIIEKANVQFALCDVRLEAELREAMARCASIQQVRHFYGDSAGSLDRALQNEPAEFDDVATAANETCLIAFTSGTSGEPKGTMHFHRDVMAICDCWPQSTLRPHRDDIFIGSPPLAFTFGLGGLLLFPIRVGACTVLLERARPDLLLEAITEFAATICFTTPTGYRAMAPLVRRAELKSLRKCVSAGEVLPASTRALWRDATGIELIDGIGATELLHIFISSDEHSARPGATGKPIPGYQACVMREDGRPAAAGEVGALAIKGPTGCRYLGGDRQSTYVKNGWNYTGDAYSVDADGYFVCHGRTDDIIVSSGYKIAAPEVEAALLEHEAVKACVVVAAPDEARGQLVKAFIVLEEGVEGTSHLVEDLQNFVKARIAPYKYPRAIEFRGSLPTSEAGKLQRFKLRE